MINKFNILNEAKYFPSEIFQDYLVFIPAKKYIKYFSGTTRNDLWKSNEMSKENIEDITKSDSSFPSTLVDHYIFPDVNFNGRCLINYISIHNKNNESIHFLHTNSIVKKFKHRLYIK